MRIFADIHHPFIFSRNPFSYLIKKEVIHKICTQVRREGNLINKSLLTFGKVVSLLAEESRKKDEQGKLDSAGEIAKSKHLPIRESTLTRLLDPYLGSNAKVESRKML